MRTKSRLLRAFGVVAVGVLTVASLATPAGAVSRQTETLAKMPVTHALAVVSSIPGAKYAGMTIEGFDASVAKRHGYRVLTLDNGETLSITPARLAALGANPAVSKLEAAAAAVYRVGAGIQPDNYIYGNCGDSYIFIAASGGDWSELTGYDVVAPVDDFEWITKVYDYNWSTFTTREWSDHPTNPSWEGSDGPPPTMKITTEYYHAAVSTGIAWLDTGVICYTGFPTDETEDPR